MGERLLFHPPPPGPTDEPNFIRALLARVRLARVLRRFHTRPVWAAFMFVNGFITLALLASLSVITGTPLVFPSLGPTAFLFFFDPHAPASSPRNAIIGHAIALLCGYFSLVVFGLVHAGSAIGEGVTWPRAFAAALSLALTGALVILFKAAHPPAGATTLIVSLGFVTRVPHLVIIELAVAVLVVQALIINRLAGVDYPLWAPHTPHDSLRTPNDERLCQPPRRP